MKRAKILTKRELHYLEESKRIKEGTRMMKRVENCSGDEKHEIEGNRAFQGPQAASERVRTVTEENMELGSDKEHDDLTKRVWEKSTEIRTY